jgi:hypothetical protein
MLLLAQTLPTTNAAISALILLVILGLIGWLVFRFVPMAEPFRTGVVIVGVIIVVIILLRLFGLLA